MPALVGVSYDIVARVIGMESAASRVVRESQEAGARAGSVFSEAFSGRATAATSTTARAMATEVNAATRTMETASARVQKMRDAEFDQIGRLRVAESKLSADRARYMDLAATNSGASAAKIEGANARVIASEEAVMRVQRARVAAQAASVAAVAGQAAANDALATSQAAAAGTAGVAATRMKTAATVGLGAFVIGSAAAIKSAANFQESQVRLVASAGETEHGMHIASDGILKLAGDVGYSAGELSKGLYGIESAGYHGADGVKVLRAAAQGAKAENADLTEVNNGLTTSMHDFHFTADQATTVMSKMVVAVGNSKENFQNFSASLHSVEPAASAAGISIEDVYGTLAQMTQTGMSAAQATENMRNAINSLSNPTQQMRDQMASLGLNADDVKMKLGERGLAGSMQDISAAIVSKMSPAGKIVIDTMYKNAQATADAKKMFDSLPPAAKKVAAAVLDGSESFKDYRKNAGGLDVLQKNQVDQWLSLQKKISGYSGQLKSGKSDIENYNQAMKLSTGTVAGQAVALSVTGEHADKTNALIKKIGDQTAEAGDNVKGWHEIQGNFNTRLAQFKDGLGAAGIQIGTTLLPAATKFVTWLGVASTYLTHHEGLLKGIVIAIGGLVAAWATIKIAQGVWSGLRTVVGGVGTAIRGVGVAARFSGGLIASAAGGVKSLATGARDYWNWTGKARLAAVKDFVATKASAAAQATQSAAAWVAGGVRSAGAWAAMQARATAAFLATKAQAAGAATASAASWVASNARAAASFAIMKAAMVAQAVASRVAAAAQWLWNAAMSANPIGAIIVAITALVAGIIYAYTHFKWFRDGVQAVWHFIYNQVIKRYIDLVKVYFRVLAAVFTWIYDEVIRPTFRGIEVIWKWLYDNVIRRYIDLIKGYINAWGATFSWLYDHVIKPVADGIGSALRGIRDGFKSTVEWVSTQWGRLENIVKVPAKFIIETVYNGGIEPLWNGIAGVFGLGKLNKVDVSKFAGGGIHDGAGVVPGYAPGRDTVPARLGKGMGVLVPEAVRAIGPAAIGVLNRGAQMIGGGVNSLLSPGEASITPAGVAALGGAQGIWSINHMFSGGRKNANGAIPGINFDTGGVKPPINISGKGQASDHPGGVLGRVASAASSVADTVGDVASWATDPVGKLKKLFESWIGTATGSPTGGGGGDWIKAVTSVPSKMLDGAVNMIKGWFGSHPQGGVAGLGVGGGVAAAPAQVYEWILQGLAAVGLPATPGWVNGFRTLIMRESSGNPKAINLTDSNARAGHPSQGLTQTIPSTFAANHQPGTSNDITDPVASVAASANYVMRNYHVLRDGSNFAANVQQANSAAGAKGYAGGGVAGLALRHVIPYAGGGVVSGPQNALDAVKRSTATYNWGGADLAKFVDCSGLVSDAQDIAMGGAGNRRLGATGNVLDGSWPNLVNGASASDIFSIGANATHMAAQILGTNIEARTTGERIRIGADAVSPWDKQFTVQKHVDPAAFKPPYVAGAASGADSASTSSETADLQSKITKATDAMNKDLADVKAAQASVNSDLASAARADEQAAAAKTAALRVKYTTAAAKYRANADQQRANVVKNQHDAEQQKATIAKLKGQLTSGVDPTASTSSDSSGGESLSFHDFGSKLGGVAADAISESFSLGNIGPDLITGSPLFKIGAAFAGAKYGKPYTPSVFPQKKGIAVVKPELHDDGGYLKDGISVISKVTRKPELNLGPERTAKLEQLLDSDGGTRSGPMVSIGTQHVHNGDGHKVGREISREMSPYAQKRRR